MTTREVFEKVWNMPNFYYRYEKAKDGTIYFVLLGGSTMGEAPECIRSTVKRMDYFRITLLNYITNTTNKKRSQIKM